MKVSHKCYLNVSMLLKASLLVHCDILVLTPTFNALCFHLRFSPHLIFLLFTLLRLQFYAIIVVTRIKS